MAPTSIAAQNINGSTIHKFFKMVLKDNITNHDYLNLNKTNLKIFRSVYQNLKLIIASN